MPGRFSYLAAFLDRRTRTAALALCLSATFLNQQATSQPAQTVISGQVELARLVDLCAQSLELSIEYDASQLKGEVTLRQSDALSKEELWALTNRILAARGFAVVQMPGAKSNVLSVVKLADASGLASVEHQAERVEDIAAGPGFVSAILRIDHQPIAKIVEAVKLVLSKPGGSITDVGLAGMVLISDLRPRVDEAMQLIEVLDVPSETPIIENIPARFVSSTQLAALVTAAATARDAVAADSQKGKVLAAPDGSEVILVAPIEEADQWRALIQRFDQREEVVTQSYSPQYFSVAEVGQLVEQVAHESAARGSGDQWKLVSDDLTGTLIVTATPSEHERITALMDRLNAMPAEARRPVRVFAIRNRSVTQIVEVLSRLLEAGVLEGSTAEDQSQVDSSTDTQMRSVERVPAARFTVVPSGQSPATTPMTPSPPAAQPGLPTPTRPMPSPAGSRSSPRSDVLHAPLTLTADEGTNTLIAVGEARLLSQLADLIRQLDVRQPQVMIEVMVVNLSEADTLDLGMELKKIEVVGSTEISLSSLFGLGTGGRGIPDSIVPGRGGTGVVLSPGDFSVVLKALQTVNRGRTLSFPKVLVNNNQQATLDSILQQPFVSTNASDTVATTSFGGSDNAGTVITIKPQVAEGDHLILEYTVTLSSFVGEASDPTVPPPKQSNNLSSVVTIPDGYTVVVGGLEITSEANAVSQVPLLGDLPVVGEAFKNRSKSFNKSRFFVFIHSEVIRHESFEDLKYISDQALSDADLSDKDGWPEVKPRIIR